MITGVFPFENVSDIIKGQYTDPKNISEGKHFEMNNQDDDTLLGCNDLIRGMLKVDIKERLSVPAISEHPWVNLSQESEQQQQQQQVKEVQCTVVSPQKEGM